MEKTVDVAQMIALLEQAIKKETKKEYKKSS
jgi:hypothetical protein